MCYSDMRLASSQEKGKDNSDGPYAGSPSLQDYRVLYGSLSMYGTREEPIEGK